jgi:hypothetical protein
MVAPTLLHLPPLNTVKIFSRLVYNSVECKALKSLFNVSTPLDPDVFESSTQPVKFVLRPKEDIYIPFVYSSNATKEEFDHTVCQLSYHLAFLYPNQLQTAHFMGFWFFPMYTL